MRRLPKKLTEDGTSNANTFCEECGTAVVGKFCGACGMTTVAGALAPYRPERIDQVSATPLSNPSPTPAPVARQATLSESWTSLSRNARWSIAATAMVVGLAAPGYLVTQSSSSSSPPERATPATPTQRVLAGDFLTAARTIAPWMSDMELERYRAALCDGYADGMTDESVNAMLRENFASADVIRVYGDLSSTAKATCEANVALREPEGSPEAEVVPRVVTAAPVQPRLARVTPATTTPPRATTTTSPAVPPACPTGNVAATVTSVRTVEHVYEKDVYVTDIEGTVTNQADAAVYVSRGDITAFDQHGGTMPGRISKYSSTSLAPGNAASWTARILMSGSPATHASVNEIFWNWADQQSHCPLR